MNSKRRNCLECGYKLDDGYTSKEILCGACYNIENNIDQEREGEIMEQIYCESCKQKVDMEYAFAEDMCQECYELERRGK